MSIYIITIHAGFDDSSTLNEACYLSGKDSLVNFYAYAVIAAGNLNDLADLYSVVVVTAGIFRRVLMVTPEENHYLVAQMVFKICKPKNVTKVYNATLRVMNSLSRDCKNHRRHQEPGVLCRFSAAKYIQRQEYLSFRRSCSPLLTQ